MKGQLDFVHHIIGLGDEFVKALTFHAIGADME